MRLSDRLKGLYNAHFLSFFDEKLRGTASAADDASTEEVDAAQRVARLQFDAMRTAACLVQIEYEETHSLAGILFAQLLRRGEEADKVRVGLSFLHTP